MSATKQVTTSGYGIQHTSNDMLNAYALNPDIRDSHIVDVIMMIADDEGPKPMRNLRPAQKNRNGAEQFYSVHQEEYEARGRHDDRVSRVTQHNNACPKMYDELNKRKSMTDTKAIRPKTMLHNNYEIKSQPDIKYKKLKMINKPKLKSRQRGSSLRPMRKETRSRVTKSKSRGSRNSLSSSYKLYQFSNKSCQHTKSSRNIRKSDVSVMSEPIDKNISTTMARSSTKSDGIRIYDEINSAFPVPTEKKRESSEKFNRNESESNHEIDSRNPDTSHPSVSSYNSYLSMDHEPMVAP